MRDVKEGKKAATIRRRDFIKSTTAAGFAVAFAGRTLSQEKPQDKIALPPQPQPAAPVGAEEELRVALIGCGEQGRVLMEACLRIPGIHIAAVCDIWEYSRTYSANYLKKYGVNVSVYEDYRELLAKEKGLAAAVIERPALLEEQIRAVLVRPGPVVCDVRLDTRYEFSPKLSSEKRPDGRIVSKPLEDLSPLLPREELRENLLIPSWPEES